MYFELIFQYKRYQVYCFAYGSLIFLVLSEKKKKNKHCSFSIELPLTFVKNLLNIYVRIYF